jgi:hypothetical protein
MTTLRNEILPVKELSKRFVTASFKMLQLSSETTKSIEKTIIAKNGFSNVIGLKIQDIKNERFNPLRVGEINPISGCVYSETKFITITKWIYE